jgi:hypothetical protein
MRSLIQLGLIAGALLAGDLALGKTILSITNNYGGAGESSLWKGLGKGQIPPSLMGQIGIDTPSKAYQAPYESVFLQNEWVVVCYRECSDTQPRPSEHKAKNKGRSGDFVFAADDLNTIKMTNTYFWVNRLLRHMQTLGFHLDRRLIVRVDREIPSPVTGVDIANSAFFNPADWTLSFLPIRADSGILMRSTDFVSPALDPSVVMHETMHAVFEQLIGTTLNQEMLGLHEAFADYFALDVLGDTRLGLVFSKGRGLRRNDDVLQYKPKMEVHELGNVVSSALLTIRSQVGGLPEARDLAFRTILAFGKDPYIAAGDVARIHLELARKKLGASQLLAAEDTWAKTKLVAAGIDRKTIVAPRRFQTSFQGITLKIFTRLPQSVGTQWSSPKEEVSRICVNGVESFQKDESNRLWLNTAIKHENRSLRPIRALIDTTTKSVIAAFSEDNSSIEPTDVEAFADVKALSDNLTHVIKWWGGEHQQMIDLMKGGGPLASTMVAANVRTTRVVFTINGISLSGWAYIFDVQPSPSAFLLISLFSQEAANIVFSLDKVVLYTVENWRVRGLNSPMVSWSQRLVGVATHRKGGLVETTLVTEYVP